MPSGNRCRSTSDASAGTPDGSPSLPAPATLLHDAGSSADAGPVGAAHLYRGAGIVLRCPHCNNVLAKIVKNDSQVWIDFQGIRTLELAV